MSAFSETSDCDSQLWEYFEAEQFTDMTVIGSDGRVRSYLAVISHFYPPIGDVVREHFKHSNEVFISIPDFSSEEIKIAMTDLFKENKLQGLLDVFGLNKENHVKNKNGIKNEVSEGNIKDLPEEENIKEMMETRPVKIKCTESEKTSDETSCKNDQLSKSKIDMEIADDKTELDTKINDASAIAYSQEQPQVYAQPSQKNRRKGFNQTSEILEDYEPNWDSPFVPYIPKSNGKSWTCGVCGLKVSSSSYLKAHVDALHRGVQYPCKDCDYKTPQKYNLSKHIKFKHTDLEKLMKYICVKCGKKYSKKSSLKVHEQTHNDRSIKCDKCTTSFNNLVYLKRHMRTVHGEENYSCDVCGRKFTTQPRLNDHFNSIHLDHDERKYICQTCGKGFHKIIAYKNHMNKHLGLKPYKCPAKTCDKGFSDDTSWAHHKRKCSLLKHHQLS